MKANVEAETRKGRKGHSLGGTAVGNRIPEAMALRCGAHHLPHLQPAGAEDPLAVLRRRVHARLEGRLLWLQTRTVPTWQASGSPVWLYQDLSWSAAEGP